jgi:hypothetical protein
MQILQSIAPIGLTVFKGLMKQAEVEITRRGNAFIEKEEPEADRFILRPGRGAGGRRRD